MAKKNDLAQQPGGGMPQDENRMMQAAQLAAMMAQGMQQTRQPEPRREAEAAPGTGSAAGQQISAGEPAAGRTENPMVQMLQSLTGQTGGQTGQPEGTYFTAAAEPAIGEDEIRRANDLLQKYKAGKAALDKRIVDNELWFRMGHWKNYKNKMMEGKPKPSSGWLFNSIANKHADAMDNYPEPNVLPRAADDEQTAKVLSKILPTVLEQCDYETAYSDTWWRKLKTGTGVKGVFWDPMLRGGLGDISIRSVNVLMLYWEPGVEDKIRRGIGLEAAYRAAYFDQLMTESTARTAKQVEQGVAARIQQRAQRPAENGAHPGAAAETKVDVAHMTAKQRAELAKRARRGERIVL